MKLTAVRSDSMVTKGKEYEILAFYNDGKESTLKYCSQVAIISDHGHRLSPYIQAFDIENPIYDDFNIGDRVMDLKNNGLHIIKSMSTKLIETTEGKAFHKYDLEMYEKFPMPIGTKVKCIILNNGNGTYNLTLGKVYTVTQLSFFGCITSQCQITIKIDNGSDMGNYQNRFEIYTESSIPNSIKPMSKLQDKMSESFMTPDKEKEILDMAKDLKSKIEILREEINNKEQSLYTLQGLFDEIDEFFESTDPEGIDKTLERYRTITGKKA